MPTPEVIEPPDERYDRQVRIPGWNQEVLSRARLGVCGDDPWLTGLVAASAAALGINRVTVVAPELDPRLMTAAQGLNPDLDLAFFPGFASHFLLEDLFRGSNVLIDLCHHALASKLLLALAHREGRPVVRGYDFEQEGRAGVRLFTYQKGREWRELLEILPQDQLPSLHHGDPVMALIIAGLVLEETKKLLLGEPVTSEVVSYGRKSLAGAGIPDSRPSFSGADDQSGPPHPIPLPPMGGEGENAAPFPSPFLINKSESQHPSDSPCALHTENRKPKTENLAIAVVGAGALGNFVALGLAALGFAHLTFIDPDRVEVTNLNRQILFWDAVGQPKAEALAARITEWFEIAPRAEPRYVTRDTDLGEYAVVFDCTDNFESRIVLSEKCRERGQTLISGGTGVEAGQVVIFNPATGGPAPAELLGLYDLVSRRPAEVRERQRASCLYAPDPAVIMTNQIIAGIMVEALRRLLAGEAAPNLFYDARGEKMLQAD